MVIEDLKRRRRRLQVGYLAFSSSQLLLLKLASATTGGWRDNTRLWRASAGVQRLYAARCLKSPSGVPLLRALYVRARIANAPACRPWHKAGETFFTFAHRRAESLFWCKALLPEREHLEF